MNEAAEALSSKFMYGGSAVAGGSWGACRLQLTGDDWTMIFGAIGALVAVIGLATNIWFKWQHLKLARSKAQADPEA